MKRVRSKISMGLTISLAVAGLRLASSAAAATLTRSEAVTALFTPGSGVTLNTNATAVWSPFANFGAGPGQEGLLPVGARVDPFIVGAPPFPGPGLSNAHPAYFFWLDDLPAAHFEHPVRFVLLRADIPAPTVGNGGIVVSTQGWWPRVTVPPSAPREFFQRGELRTSGLPPGPGNPDGLIAGPGYDPSGPPPAPAAPAPLLIRAAAPPNNAGGLIIRGSDGAEFGHDVETFERDLRDHYGVPADRIVKARGGATAMSNDVYRAITNLCALEPPVDKIFIRTTSHGYNGGYMLGGVSNTAADMCSLFRRLAAKGVPICLFMEGCHTASLTDVHQWNFPVGSRIFFAANTNRSSWGSATKFTNAAFGCVTNSLFVDAFSRCLNDPALNRRRPATDEEAFAWLLTNAACYTFTGDRNMYYPANAPAGSATPNPDPQTHSVGGNPTNININVCNATGAPRANYHMILQGDVRDGVGRSWNSDAGDHIGSPWDGNPTVTYDPVRDETMVCWQNPSAPVPVGGYIHVGYFRAAGGLRPMRQGWGSATPSTPPSQRVPSAEKTFRFVPGGGPLGIIRLAARGVANGGWGDPVQTIVAVRFVPTPVTLEALNLGNPLIANNPPTILGTAMLGPDTAREFLVQLPPIPPGQSASLILETRLNWTTSNNQTICLESFPVTPPVPLTEMFIRRVGNNSVAIFWSGNGLLESAPDVLGPWEVMPPANPPVIRLIDGPREFFRLVTPGPVNAP